MIIWMFFIFPIQNIYIHAYILCLCLSTKNKRNKKMKGAPMKKCQFIEYLLEDLGKTARLFSTDFIE